MLTFARLTLPAKISLTRFLEALLMATKFNLPITPAGIADNVDAFDDLAQDIANPPVDRPIRGGIARAGQKYCDYLGAIPGQASGLFGPGFSAGSLLCEPYWDSQGYDPPEQDPPLFTGGQCAGVQYWVFTSWEGERRSCDGSNPVPVSSGPPLREGPFVGPLSYADESIFNNCGNGSRSSYVIRISGQNGSTTMGFGVGFGYASAFSPTVTVARVDGAADTCGSLPTGGFVPGANPPPTPTFPPGEEPGVDPDGQPFIWVPPIESPVGGEPIEIPPDADQPGGAGDGGGPTEPPVAGDEQPGENGDEEFPPPEDGKRWVGCCIRLTAMPQGTGVVPGTAPETILTQVVGNARLLFDSASGDGYDTPVQIRSAGLCLWEPVKGLSPKGVRVNLKPGFEYAYTPFSVAEDE